MGYAEPQGRLRITRYVLEHMTSNADSTLSTSVLTKIFFAATQRFLNEPVEEIRSAAGNIIRTVIEKQFANEDTAAEGSEKLNVTENLLLWAKSDSQPINRITAAKIGVLASEVDAAADLCDGLLGSLQVC